MKRTPPVLHPKSLSPDPTYGRAVRNGANGVQIMDVFPSSLVRATPMSAAVRQWASRLDQTRCTPLRVTPNSDGRAELLVDFGTEVDGVLEVETSVKSPANVMAYFGEVIPEVEGEVFGLVPDPRLPWHLPARRHCQKVAPRGFRFLRLIFNDVQGEVVIHRLGVHCEFTFQQRPGDFWCDDARFQRVWQTSLYTARICTKPDTMWDGVKRDRVGWYGDARITKEACDDVFFEPSPAESMMLALPTREWANTIPTYSFDAIAMLRQHILAYGLSRPCTRDVYARIVDMLAWARRTQTDKDGFIKRKERHYFGGTGFVDWSLMPQGGRMEELCCLQAKYVEALQNAAQIATWLGKAADARRYQAQADALAAKVVRRFWSDGKGFIHTLNHIGPVENPYLPGHCFKQHETTYIQKVRLGPSGPTRQSNALAVWAGLADDRMKRTILKRVFNNSRIPMVITPYFSYFEQFARARCGDPAGAIMHMRDYIGTILETEDAATVWEVWDPKLTDFRRYSSHRELNWHWQLSMCHAWGCGSVNIGTRFLLGIEAMEPGFASVQIRPCLSIPWAFKASVPTPVGVINVERPRRGEPVIYSVPDGIRVQSALPAGEVRIESRRDRR